MNPLLPVTFVLVALCSLGNVDSSAYDKIVSHSRIRARKEGPNVCALQQVMGTKSKKYFSTCRNWYRGSICGKKAVVLYECCPGYMKLEGMRGCPAVAPIDHVYGTLGLLHAKTTQQYSEMAGMREQLEGQGSFTMFAPSDDAWAELDPRVRSSLVSNVNVELHNALHYHMVNRRFLTKDLKNDLTISSMYNKLGLYINHYSNGIVTVNCARIIHGNQVSTNGVVHVIDRVISGVGNTIKDVLDVNDELSSFSAAALASGMMDKLGRPGHYTLFAPTNDAFKKLSPGHLERMMGDKDVIAALVNYHLLNSAQCSEAIMAGSVFDTAEGSTIEIGCDGDSLTVNGIKMVLKKDIVTTNGVIHLIREVLIPDLAKEGLELIGESQKTFSKMVSEVGLAAAMRPKTEYTILAPVNTAFTNQMMSKDRNLLRTILENHILKLKITLSELYNGQLLETLAGKLLRVFIYRTAVCIENACMLRGSKEGSKSALHIMRSLIEPADKSIYRLLVLDGRFKIFLSLMEEAGLTDLLKQEGSYTIFAPTDEAFDGLTPEDFQLLKSDVNALRVILLYHFSNGIFINGGLETGVTNMLKTLQGNNLRVFSVNNTIQVNSVDVPTSDLMATNGVIHVVKNVLYPPDLPVGHQDLLVLLKKLIRFIHIKFISGYRYVEIPLTFLRPEVKTVTRVIHGKPSVSTITKVIEGKPIITKITKVIETEPTVTRVVVEGEPSITKLTKVIESQPSITQVTRVIEGQDVDIKKLTGEAKFITVNESFVLEGPEFSKITIHGNQKLSEEESDRLTKLIKDAIHDADGKTFTGEARFITVNESYVLEGPDFSKITTIHGNPKLSEEESERITKLIKDATHEAEGKTFTGEARIVRVNEPYIIKGPDFSKITTIHGNPQLIDAESERITKLIKEGGRYSAARKPPPGMRRRKFVKRPHNSKQ